METTMNNMKRIYYLIPLLIIIGLVLLLATELLSARPERMPASFRASAANTPRFSLPDLFNPNRSFTPQSFGGRVVLLNVWASWCNGCYEEHQVLLKIKRQYRIPIFGIDYKDSPQVAIKFLKRNGNPFDQVGSDPDGRAAVDLGIIGTPETFIINKQGQIVYRHIGPVTMSTWEEVLLPIVQRYQQE
jgi:cytochrome c biogenesis protein CcmG/thiol:disulfide interchange protein DsbE